MKSPIHNALWMIVGCVLPFLALFLLPAVGLNDSLSIAAFFVLMMGCHLMHGAILNEPKKNPRRAQQDCHEDH